MLQGVGGAIAVSGRSSALLAGTKLSDNVAAYSGGAQHLSTDCDMVGYGYS